MRTPSSLRRRSNQRTRWTGLELVLLILSVVMIASPLAMEFYAVLMPSDIAAQGALEPTATRIPPSATNTPLALTLAAIKSTGQSIGQVTVGEQFTYAIQVTNAGTTSLAVTVNDSVPGILRVSNAPDGCTTAGNNVSCSLNVAVNSRQTVLVAVLVTASAIPGSTIKDSVTAQSALGNAEATVSVSVSGAPPTATTALPAPSATTPTQPTPTSPPTPTVTASATPTPGATSRPAPTSKPAATSRPHRAAATPSSTGLPATVVPPTPTLATLTSTAPTSTVASTPTASPPPTATVQRIAPTAVPTDDDAAQPTATHAPPATRSSTASSVATLVPPRPTTRTSVTPASSAKPPMPTLAGGHKLAAEPPQRTHTSGPIRAATLAPKVPAKTALPAARLRPSIVAGQSKGNTATRATRPTKTGIAQMPGASHVAGRTALAKVQKLPATSGGVPLSGCLLFGLTLLVHSIRTRRKRIRL
ncbi:MAG: hypothetical protein H0X37_22705 [Herpetosiphonaceae bacterium]|nr:hypothetical protein [Herpetosiphonaceae bacterium]